MKIAFWSPTPFAGRKSTHLLLFALQELASEGGEQLVIHADAEGSGPEHFLLSGNHRNRLMKQNEFGIELLAKALHCERGSKETVVNASYTFAEGKLHVLPAGSKRFYQGENVAAEICNIIRYADKLFCNVWIELPAGFSEFTSEILETADCVIVNLAQSPWEVGEIEKIPQFENTFYLLGAYEQRNIYTGTNLKLLFPKLRGCCETVPYDEAFLAACCKGEAEKVWLRETGKNEKGDVSVFYRGAERAFLKWKEGQKAGESEVIEEEKKSDRNLIRYGK